MTSDRVYRGRLSQDDALAELERCAGTQFDPAVVTALAQELQPAKRDARGNRARLVAFGSTRLWHIPRVKTRALRLLERLHLLRPAYRGYETLRSFGKRRPQTAGELPLPPRRLMVRVAGTPDADWFLHSGQVSADDGS